MSDRARCPSCGDLNYPTDPVCLSCGTDLRVSASEPCQTGAASPEPEGCPADWEITTPDPARTERLGRARELALQVEALIEQGYHKLPKEPGARYGPADDVSDLCREIGECYLKNEDYGEAAGWLGRALVIAPGNVIARAYLVGCLCRMERYDEAKAWYEDTPGDPIDRNVVRAWLEGPGVTHSHRPYDLRTRPPVAKGQLLASRDRVLPLIAEPRSA